MEQVSIYAGSYKGTLFTSYYPKKRWYETVTPSLMLWAAWILPWLSLFFLDKTTVRRYMPVSIFSALLLTVVFEMAHVFDWWTIYAKIVPWGTITNVSYAYGLFMVGTLWVFVFTYRSYILYVLTNLAVDAFWSYVMDPLFVRMGFYKLDHMTHTGVWLIMTVMAQLLYLYQLWQEGGAPAPGPESGKRKRWEWNGLGRQKAK